MLLEIIVTMPENGQIIVSDTVRMAFHAVWFLVTGVSR